MEFILKHDGDGLKNGGVLLTEVLLIFPWLEALILSSQRAMNWNGEIYEDLWCRLLGLF